MNDEDIKKWCSQWKNIPFKKIISYTLWQYERRVMLSFL